MWANTLIIMSIYMGIIIWTSFRKSWIRLLIHSKGEEQYILAGTETIRTFIEGTILCFVHNHLYKSICRQMGIFSQRFIWRKYLTISNGQYYTVNK